MESNAIDLYADGVELLNAGLIFLILLAGFVQPSAPRLFSAFIFVGASIGLIIADKLDLLSDYMLYMSSALASVLVMILLSASVLVSSVVLTLHKICLAAILLNLGGYIAYELDLSYLGYNLSFSILYIITIITLLKKDGRSDVGGFDSNSWRATISFNFRSWLVLVLQGKR